jgi:type IV pilus assembly protein PilB
VSTTLSEETMRELQLDPSTLEGATFYEPKGCYDCNDTGYRGRKGIYEVLPISSTTRQLILDRSSAVAIKQQAMKEGMLSLRMNALEKLKRGVTGVEEVLKESAADE